MYKDHLAIANTFFMPWVVFIEMFDSTGKYIPYKANIYTH